MEREPRYFEYGEAEVAYLAARDPRLGEAMAVIGRIEREVHPDLFAVLANCIVGQQISTKAQTTIWNRMLDRFGEVTPEAMAACSDDELQQVGISQGGLHQGGSRARAVRRGGPRGAGRAIR